jgi:predicted HTH domain antitoxin
MESIMTSATEKIIETYQKGEISLGKFAQEIGMDPVSARDFLKSNGIKIETCYTLDIPSDTKNA